MMFLDFNVKIAFNVATSVYLRGNSACEKALARCYPHRYQRLDSDPTESPNGQVFLRTRNLRCVVVAPAEKRKGVASMPP